MSPLLVALFQLKTKFADFPSGLVAFQRISLQKCSCDLWCQGIRTRTGGKCHLVSVPLELTDSGGQGEGRSTQSVPLHRPDPHSSPTSIHWIFNVKIGDGFEPHIINVKKGGLLNSGAVSRGNKCSGDFFCSFPALGNPNPWGILLETKVDAGDWKRKATCCEVNRNRLWPWAAVFSRRCSQ